MPRTKKEGNTSEPKKKTVDVKFSWDDEHGDYFMWSKKKKSFVEPRIRLSDWQSGKVKTPEGYA